MTAGGLPDTEPCCCHIPCGLRISSPGHSWKSTTVLYNTTQWPYLSACSSSSFTHCSPAPSPPKASYSTSDTIPSPLQSSGSFAVPSVTFLPPWPLLLRAPVTVASLPCANTTLLPGASGPLHVLFPEGPRMPQTFYRFQLISLDKFPNDSSHRRPPPESSTVT